MMEETDLDPFAHWGSRTTLFDGDGRVVFVFTLSEGTRSGRPWADGVWRPDRVALGQAVDSALSTFTGHAFSTSDRDLVEALRDAGATELRHAHTMSHGLSSVPEVAVEGLRTQALPAADLAARAAELGVISFRAYPPGHPDHEHESDEDAAAELAAISRGELLGAYLDVSQVATTPDGRAVGACLIVDREGAAPDGGPWIIDVFRDPDSSVKGVGAAMITAALAAAKAAGLPSVSLAVSHSNANAVALYTSLGFVDADENWTLALP